MTISVDSLDHLVLTVKDINQTVNFYTESLGMTKVVFGEQRVALAFGQQKINLHLAGHEFEPKAKRPTPGSADLCFLTLTPLDSFIGHFQQKGIEISEGPIQRTGANGPILSIYIRDPDDNLIEISNSISNE